MENASFSGAKNSSGNSEIEELREKLFEIRQWMKTNPEKAEARRKLYRERTRRH